MSNQGGGGAPALSPELNKAEARQASNLRVTTKAIDALHARVARAKRELDKHNQKQLEAAGGGAGAASSEGLRAGAKSPTSSAAKPTTAKSPTRSPSKGKGAACKSPPRSMKAAAAATRGGGTGGKQGGAQAMDLEGEGGGSGVGVAGILSELASDVAGLKTLDAVGSEHKNFHATISKLAKAAEKQFGGNVESVRRTPALNEKALHTAIITHLYRRGAFRAAAKFSEDSTASIPAETTSARRSRQAQPRPCREVVREATESFGGGGELVGVPACPIAFPPVLGERRPGEKTRSDDVCKGASDARGGGPHAGVAGAHGEPPVVGKLGGFALQPPPLPGAVDSREGVGGGRRQPGVGAVAGEHPLRRFPGWDPGPADPCEDGGGGAGKQPGVERDAGAAAGGAPPAGLALPQHVLLPGLERAKHPGQPTGPAQVRACGAPIERQPPREKWIEV
ncbi:unnamed protein product [Ectocarpus sp. 6 AP-2014]